MSEAARRAELASFLRSRRHALDPVAAGFKPGPRRRTPGLRRSEVAQLSGVSVSWYTWLEQQKEIAVSRQAVDALAAALRLTNVEHRYLLTLAGIGTLPGLSEAPPVPTPVRRLVHAVGPNPAAVSNPFFDLLAWNRAFAGLVGGLSRVPAAERNSLWLAFVEPSWRILLADWDSEARRMLGQLREAMAEWPDDPRGAELTGALREASPSFRVLWAEYPVKGTQPSRIRFDHPGAGRLTMDYLRLDPALDPRLHVTVYMPADTESRDRLGLL